MWRFYDDNISKRDYRGGKAIRYGLGALAVTAVLSGYVAVHRFENALGEYYDAMRTASVVQLCGDYENNYQRVLDLGHEDIAIEMERVCRSTIDQLVE